MTSGSLNDGLRENLKRIAQSDHVSHAYLLSGEDTEKGMDIARQFAELIADSPADILTLEHEKPNLISVDDVRTGINESVYIKPYGRAKKVYIVPEAQKMNPQAQNALLKTLEEPPEYVVILLVADSAESFLQTILSRTVKLTVSADGEDALETDTERQAALELARQVMRDAVSMDTKKMLDTVSLLSEKKLYIKDILERLRTWLRDVRVWQMTEDPSMLLFSKDAAIVRQFAEKARPFGVTKITEAIDTAERRLDVNVNFDVTAELLLETFREALQKA